MKQSLKKLVVMLLALAITVGSFPTAALAAPAQDETPVATEENTVAPSAEQDEAAEETVQPAEETAQPEETTEPAAQAETKGEAEVSSEMTKADAKALNNDLKAAVTAEVYKGNNVVDVSKYNAPVKNAENAAEEVTEENAAVTETSVGVDENGNANVVVVDVDPVMAMAIAEANTTAYTEEEQNQIKAAYDDYFASITGDNAQYFGALTPYFTAKETNGYPINAMLSVASISLHDDGYYYNDKTDEQQSAQDIVATISAFTTANQFGVNYYGSQLIEAKDEALNEIDDSMTVPQKLLALNDWLAQKASFDMAYIMNSGKEKGEETLVAKDPQEHPKRQEIIAALKSQLKEQFLAQGMDDATAEAYAGQYAEQMADGVIGAWEGNQFGILTEAHENKGVCMGYAYAYAYLVQWMFPDIYMENGQFKDYKELNYEATEVEAKDEEGNPVVDEDGNPVMTTEYTWNENTPAMVDFVRIDFDTEVRMLGERSNFGDVHYWNAAKVDGKWYYIDPCYTDIYVECMSRDRVETNGNMNHMYFMFSDTNCRQLYDGYYKNINTLYENIATDTTYEDAWFAFAKSPVFDDGNKWYYFYDSTDLIEMKTNYSNTDEETEYKLVYHDGSQEDSSADFVTLVDFNNGQILQNGKMVDSDLLKELWEKHQAYTEKYPSIITSCAPEDGKLYFNIANCIMSYDLSSGELVKFKEYNKVSASRDDTVVFGGMAFSVVEDGTEGALTVENSPIASMTIKDGKMYVDVATNYAYISGQEVIGSKTHEIKEDKGYGWEYEETNYNSEYNSYMEEHPEYAQDYDEDNDNDEFMWSANFVDTIEISHLTGNSHEYEKVTVDPFCGEDGFTENRCKTCGAIEVGTREVNEDTALKHHYVKHHEVYYDKNDNGSFIEGDAYVCVICKDAQEEQPETMGDHVYHETWEWAEDYSSAKVTLTCVGCTNKLDCTQALDEETYVKTADAEITSKRDSKCDEDGNIVYTATAKVGSKTYTDEKTEAVKAGTHSYTDPEFIWAEDGKSCKVSYKCTNGDDDHTGDNAVDATVDDGVTTDSTCTEEGKTVYTASIELNGKTYTDTKEIKIAKKPHSYEDGVCTVCGAKQAATLVSGIKTANAATGVKVSWSAADVADGYRVYRKNSKGGWTFLKDVKADTLSMTDNGIKLDDGLKSGTTYTYTVRAYVMNGDERKPAAEYNTKGVSVKYLAQPSVSVANTSSGVTIKWNKIGGAAGYRVYRLGPDDSSWKKIATVKSGSTVSYTDQKAVSGENYRYTVRAESNGTLSSYDSEISIMFLSQPKPSIANAAKGVQLKWNNVSGAETYRIYRKGVNAKSWKKIGEVKKGTTSFVDETAKAGATGMYTVKAIAGSSASSYNSGLTIKYLTQPSVSVAEASNGITVKWGKVTGASGYRVYRRTGSDGKWSTIATIKSGSTISYTDKNAKKGTTYQYTVRATSGDYISSYKASESIKR